MSDDAGSDAPQLDPVETDTTTASREGDGRAASGVPGARPPWQRALATVGRTTASIAVSAGKAVAAGYRAVDPDLRRHIALTPLVGLTSIAPGDREVVPKPDDGHRVVMFVHGLGGQPGNFVAMKTWFRLHGRTRYYAFPLTDAETSSDVESADLESMGTTLAQRIRQVVEVNGLEDDATIDIVAHSMGGLATRLALRDATVAERVRQVVTLGTPHGGTWAARYADTVLTRALRPSSVTLQRLEAQLPWPGPPTLPPLTALWSRADMLLLPHDTACVEGAENIEIEGASHLDYLIAPSIMRRVFEAIA